MEEVKIEKVESAVTYSAIEGHVKLMVNGKEVTVTYYQREDYNMGCCCDADHDIHSEEELTEDEREEVEEIWIDYK